MNQPQGATAATIARTVTLVIALLNSIFATVGLPLLDIEENLIYEGASAVFLVIAAGVAWWKNNSFTKEAIEADQFLQQQKEKNQ